MDLYPEDSGDIEITRRTFLMRAIVALGVLMGAILGLTGGGYFLSPLFRRKEERWVDVGAAKDFLLGVPTKVNFVERKRDAWITSEQRSSAWVLTADGEKFIAFDPRCTHLGCPYRWNSQEKKFLCPCHNAVFDRDGTVVSGPAPRPLDHYKTKVASGHLWVLPGGSGERAG